MPLSGLYSLLSRSEHHRHLIDLLRKRNAVHAQAVLLDSAVSFYAGALRNELNAPVLLLTARPARSRRLYEDILVWCGEDGAVFHLPEGETLPFERLTADDATTHGRIRALAALAGADSESSSTPPHSGGVSGGSRPADRIQERPPGSLPRDHRRAAR